MSDPHPTPSARGLVLLATEDGRHPVGSAVLRLFSRRGQSHLAEADVQVHPAERRRGIGTLLVDAAVAAARDEGRRTLHAQVEAGSPGEGFLTARGFRPVLTLVHARLALAGADLAALAEEVHRPRPGYRLVSWDGIVPDALAASFARSRRAMDDMPVGDGDFGRVEWDVERVRAAAAAVAERGALLHTVAAVDSADGSVVAFTELVVPGGGEGDGQHYGTGVLPEHRGRGLGHWIKAASLLHVRERHPALEGALTDTADINPYMRRINDALGYVPTHRSVLLRRDV
ncbi:GNAT family N-acetyltransferase [Streptomyces fuscigenes]|uniref:GNAT family N-acetyltransferase n=1 Tax=Streptomyces fuscigenes TaxID=1528880 RepID=UPI001F179AB0|nr:GNAT family N-acetyltransferase [Streptomyces fuscigenes]MCF3965544.1 GNAT family N-acetyltransferase [Streptomyces fuscigenes]